MSNNNTRRTNGAAQEQSSGRAARMVGTAGGGGEKAERLKAEKLKGPALLTAALEWVDAKQLSMPLTQKCTLGERRILERLLDARIALRKVLDVPADFSVSDSQFFSVSEEGGSES